MGPSDAVDDRLRTATELFLQRLRKADRGQLETLRRRLARATRPRRCRWDGCLASTRKTPFCVEHLRRLGFRIGPSTVCKGEGLFAVAQPEALAAAAELGKLPEEVEVFGPNTRVFITFYDGILMRSPEPYEIEQIQKTGEWLYCYMIDKDTYVHGALENFLGRFINAAHPDPSRANAYFSANTTKKTVSCCASVAIYHEQEVIVSSYGHGFFPELLRQLESYTLCQFPTRELVPKSAHTKRVEARELKRPQVWVMREPGSRTGAADAHPDAVLEPFEPGPGGAWWLKPPRIRRRRRSDALFNTRRRKKNGKKKSKKKKKKTTKSGGRRPAAEPVEIDVPAGDPPTLGPAAVEAETCFSEAASEDDPRSSPEAPRLVRGGIPLAERLGVPTAAAAAAAAGWPPEADVLLPPETRRWIVRGGVSLAERLGLSFAGEQVV
eukprot:tig00000042_g15671.t1